jgi:hypothetical protein
MRDCYGNEICFQTIPRVPDIIIINYRSTHSCRSSSPDVHVVIYNWGRPPLPSSAGDKWYLAFDVMSKINNFNLGVLPLIGQISYFHLLRLYAGRPKRRIHTSHLRRSSLHMLPPVGNIGIIPLISRPITVRRRIIPCSLFSAFSTHAFN